MNALSNNRFDFIGVGFGPSNLALAIAMSEHTPAHARPLHGLFIEKKPAFSWHEDMLLDGSTMQISFLKDLATLRNPSSRFTFLNYLHAKHRLSDFINLKTFFPTRVEFNDYLCWAAEQFASICAYQEEVLSITPIYQQRQVVALHVRSTHPLQGQIDRQTKHLILGVGGRPYYPQPFADMRDPRILHNAQYLQRIDQLLADGQPKRVAVIGGGQSAAEVFYDLTQRFPNVAVSLLTRSHALRPADDSPFVNEIFNPEFVDFIYQQPQQLRHQLLQRYHNTNYAVIDADLIERIYHLFYQQKVSGIAHHQLLMHTHVQQASATSDHLTLTLHDQVQAISCVQHFDVVILATGYQREQHTELLAGLQHELGGFEVERDYRLKTPDHVLPRIYLQGCNEGSHGLSDTLLSVLSVRSQEIVDSLTCQPLMRTFA